jgi:signal transduction histidine kinase
MAAERMRFETAVMQAPVAVAVFTGPDHVVRVANRRWLALGNPIDAVGRPLREILPEAARGGFLSALAEVCATGAPRELLEQAIPHTCPDGSVETRFYNVAYQPLRSAGGVVTDVIAAISDVTCQVTSRRAVEEARAAAEQASRAKDDLLRVVSHELRTPLTPILALAEALAKGQGGEPERLRHGLDIILANARAEARIIDDLIDVSSFAAGKVHLTARSVELGPIVEACVDEARPAAAAKGVALETEIAPETRLPGDAGRLAQAVRHVLSNALKFTPRGGRIAVNVTRANGDVCLRVHDTGKGIPPSELAHVFDALRTGDASLKRAHGGLGLGLCLVRHIVEAHGGRVWAESAGEGCGATLVVELRAEARPP